MLCAAWRLALRCQPERHGTLAGSDLEGREWADFKSWVSQASCLRRLTFDCKLHELEWGVEEKVEVAYEALLGLAAGLPPSRRHLAVEGIEKRSDACPALEMTRECREAHIAWPQGRAP